MRLLAIEERSFLSSGHSAEDFFCVGVTCTSIGLLSEHPERSILKSGVGKRHPLFMLHAASCNRRAFFFVVRAQRRRLFLCHPERSAEGAQSRDRRRVARLWRPLD